MLKSVIFLFFLLVPQIGDIEEKALEWFRQGEIMIGTDSQYTEAQARCFREAVALSPGFNEARYNLILILLAQEDFQEAQKQASLLITNEPESVQAYLLRAEASLMVGKTREALEDLDVFLAKYPDDAGGRELQGEALFRDGAFTDAAAAYQKAQKLGRNSLGIRINIGMSLLNSGQNEEASEIFYALAADYPQAWESHYWFGVSLRSLGRLDEAVAALEKAETADPLNERVREELIEVFLGLGRLENAGTRINRKSNKSASDYANLALMAKAENNLENAIAYFRTASGLAPENASFLAGLGDAQVDSGQIVEAIATYRRVIEINPVDFTTLLNLGGLLSDQGELPDARGFLERAVALQPSSAEAHFRLALVLDKMEDYRPAREVYEKALELGSKSLVAHFRLGFFLAEEGNVEGAMQHLATAVSGNPAKFMPFLIKEVRRVHSLLDAIRYTTPFSELINKYEDYWVGEDEEDPEEPLPVLEAPSR
jgi:tetratricopeptide (TPR) repeat protein